nr:butyrate kinase [uncultured Oscillibacter sp.]
MEKTYRILAINPGSTSTKISVFHNEEEAFSKSIRHSEADLGEFHHINEQFDFRRKMILETLENAGIALDSLDAVVARGGNMKPVVGGTYVVNAPMLEDLEIGVMGQHASNLGGRIAYAIAAPLGLDAYVVDPVIVDELEPLARYSGTPLIARKSKDHPLNQKAVGREAARRLGGRYEDYNFIIAHLGGGISVGVHKKGRLVDVNNSLDGDGPMSPERCGGLPFGSVMDLCYSGKYTKAELRKMLIGGGGMMGYLGTNDGRKIVDRIRHGDEEAARAYEAMAYQIAKEIGACAAVLKGCVDQILLTGGLAYDEMLVEWIRERVRFIAPVMLFPGEHEMEALVLGTLRVLRGQELPQTYPNPAS